MFKKYLKSQINNKDSLLMLIITNVTFHIINYLGISYYHELLNLINKNLSKFEFLVSFDEIY
jgi:hypothetical protein